MGEVEQPAAAGARVRVTGQMLEPSPWAATPACGDARPVTLTLPAKAGIGSAASTLFHPGKGARPAVVTLLVLVSFAVTGCDSADPDQARICRTALPALEAAATRVEVLRVRSPVERTIRIDYRATPSAGPALERFALCRFDPPAFVGDRGRLAAVTTDRGEVPGATLYLLQRYFIDTPEGVAADPGRDARAGLPDWPRPLAYAAQQALVGMPGAASYALLAAAYALVFGLVGRINLAFGELAAVGAAALGLVAAAMSGGSSPGLAALAGGLAAATFAAAMHGVVIGHLAFSAIPAKRAQASLIATVGLSLALSEYLRLAGGAVPDWVPPVGGEPLLLARAGDFIVTATSVGFATAALGLSAAAALVVTLRRTRYGRDWRAASDDALAAALCGVDGRRLLWATLALASALAGLAGGLMALRFGALGFAGGFGLGLKALAAAVLGGVGSVSGALAGGLAIGAFETLWSAYGPIDWRDVALYAVLIGAIVLRRQQA